MSAIEIKGFQKYIPIQKYRSMDFRRIGEALVAMNMLQELNINST